ncbi:MAG: biotin--[acetyl-CoA-carboxylase] ligase [Anaerolineae bacterium]
MLRALHPRPVRYFPSVGSTNDEALAWLAESAPEGAVVIADEQTKGRGRLGRVWYAPPGAALLFTVILRPSERVLSRMTMLGGLAVCETAQQMGLAAGIKWANDVQVNERKLSGVPLSLMERQSVERRDLGHGCQRQRRFQR